MLFTRLTNIENLPLSSGIFAITERLFSRLLAITKRSDPFQTAPPSDDDAVECDGVDKVPSTVVKSGHWLIPISLSSSERDCITDF